MISRYRGILLLFFPIPLRRAAKGLFKEDNAPRPVEYISYKRNKKKKRKKGKRKKITRDNPSQMAHASFKDTSMLASQLHFSSLLLPPPPPPFRSTTFFPPPTRARFLPNEVLPLLLRTLRYKPSFPGSLLASRIAAASREDTASHRQISFEFPGGAVTRLFNEFANPVDDSVPKVGDNSFLRQSESLSYLRSKGFFLPSVL